MRNFSLMITLLFFGMIALTSCNGSNKVLGQNTGLRSYYLLEESFTCQSFSPNSKPVPSWKGRIDLENNKFKYWSDKCNDGPILLEEKIIELTDDLNTLIYKGEVYTYTPDN